MTAARLPPDPTPPTVSGAGRPAVALAWVERPPPDVARRILTELFPQDTALAPGEWTYPLADFQEAGTRRAMGALDRWGGVVVADAVGLGKTYIALALIEDELRRDGAILVAVPAALRPTWKRLLRRLVHGRPGSVHLLSHSQLSLGRYPSTLGETVTLSVVDEAHRFRNPATRRYAALSETSRNGKMALLTATPINNSPADLLALLRLFLTDDAFAGLGVPSLRETLEGGPGGRAALRPVLREVVVRRSRSVLGSGAASPRAPGSGAASPRVEDSLARFPRRAPPRVAEFVDPHLPALVQEIDRLPLSLHSRTGERGDGGEGEGPCAAALVRLGLLKRLESGRAALRHSLRRLLGATLSFTAALESGRLLTPGRSGAGGGFRDGDPLQLVLLDLVASPCPPGLDVDRLLSAARRDIQGIRSMQRLLSDHDPKLEALATLIAELAPEKCVVFTEFRDTADDLWRRLATSTPVGRIDGAGAWLGLRPAGRGAVIQRFAPLANGGVRPPRREEVRVLLATDVLAEGLNLQDARHVISYDLPWNPVRLMQRIGRVDRLGSQHQEVVPHLFVPGTGLEEMLGLTRRLRSKLGTIAGTMDDEESLQLLRRLSNGAPTDPGTLDRDGDHYDPLESLRFRLFGSATPSAPSRRLAPAPNRAGQEDPAAPIVVAFLPQEDAEQTRAVGLLRARGVAHLVEIGSNGTVREAGAGAAVLLDRALEPAERHHHETDAAESTEPPDHRDTGQTPDTRRANEVIKITKLIRHHSRLLASLQRAPPRIRTTDPPARLARRIRSALGQSAFDLDPDLVALADHTLQRLSQPLPAGGAETARRLLQELDPDAPTDQVVRRVAELFQPSNHHRPTRNRPDEVGPTATGPSLVALILAGSP